MLKLTGQILSLLIFAGLGCWILWRWLQKSEDAPAKLIFKWGLSIIVCGAALVVAVKANDGFSQIFAVLTGAVAGLVMAITWAPNFCAFVARPFAGLYDGGDQEIDPAAMYSIADARLKKGDTTGALAEIERQLEMFPKDMEGHLKKAQIQAENLKDIPAAAQTVWSWISSVESPNPGSVALILNRLADWHLSVGRDPAAAKATLERLLQLVPETEHASLAFQRMSRLPAVSQLESSSEPETKALPKAPDRIGLQPRQSASDPSSSTEDEVAAAVNRCIERLNQHPQDNETREQLVVLYDENMGRPDLALEQLQQMVEQPYQPARHVARWLNMMADVHVRHGDQAAAKSCLEEIVRMAPDGALGEQARSRLSFIGMEIRGQKKSQAVKLGSYEKNIGLRSRGGST